ncbi:MAG: hypothetical protein QNJ09_08250 [Paracoccaceae bacterium]|nr:hypothetical protein [Paracoccaceae bacterium]
MGSRFLVLFVVATAATALSGPVKAFDSPEQEMIAIMDACHAQNQKLQNDLVDLEARPTCDELRSSYLTQIEINGANRVKIETLTAETERTRRDLEATRSANAELKKQLEGALNELALQAVVIQEAQNDAALARGMVHELEADNADLTVQLEQRSTDLADVEAKNTSLAQSLEQKTQEITALKENADTALNAEMERAENALARLVQAQAMLEQAQAKADNALETIANLQADLETARVTVTVQTERSNWLETELRLSNQTIFEMQQQQDKAVELAPEVVRHFVKKEIEQLGCLDFEISGLGWGVMSISVNRGPIELLESAVDKIRDLTNAPTIILSSNGVSNCDIAVPGGYIIPTDNAGNPILLKEGEFEKSVFFNKDQALHGEPLCQAIQNSLPVGHLLQTSGFWMKTDGIPAICAWRDDKPVLHDRPIFNDPKQAYILVRGVEQ